LGELEFRVTDTAGLEEVQEFLLPRQAGESRHTPSAAKVAEELGEYRLLDQQPMDQALQRSVLAQTELAVAEADAIVFMIDGRQGVTSLDRSFALWLRKQAHRTLRIEGANGQVVHERVRKPVLLVANKCDSSEAILSQDGGEWGAYPGLSEGWELGFGEPVAVSADHAGGMQGLHNALHSALSQVYPAKLAAFSEREAHINHEVSLLPSLRHVKLAVVGKVNTGKSTLVNTLLGSERVLTGAQPGVTRDSVEMEWRDEQEEEHEQMREQKKRDKMQEEREAKLRQTTTGKQRREMREAAAAAAAAAATPSALDGSASPLGEDDDSVSAAPVPSTGAGEDDPLPSYRFTLVDTAGLKGVTAHSHSKYSRVDAAAMGASLRAIERANVVALVVDVSAAGIEGVGEGEQQPGERKSELPAAATQGATPLHSLLFKPGRQYTETERGALLRTFARNLLTAHDLSIASKVLREGRALLLVLNKFDLVPASSPQLRQQILEGLQAQMQHLLPEAGGSGVPVLALSGQSAFDPLRGQMLKRTVRQSIIGLFERWSARVPTHALNRWLQELVRFHPPPPVRLPGTSERKKTTLKFIQQVSTGPPAFVLFSNAPAAALPEHFQSFLLGSLRRQFGLAGVPVRLMIRTRRNPYLDPQTKEKAREKARRDAQQLDEAVPRFGEEGGEGEDRAVADAEEEGEFDEADYLPDAQEIRFDYDEDAAAARETDAKDGQGEGEGEDAHLSRMEMQREEVAAAAAQARAAAKAKPFVATDSPIPRVSDAKKSHSAPAPFKINTSSIFSSPRTVAQRPGRNLGITASAKWALGRPAASAVQPDWQSKKKADKPFGTRRSKKGKAPQGGAGTMQSANVARTTAKADEWESKRRTQDKARRSVNKRREATKRSDSEW